MWDSLRHRLAFSKYPNLSPSSSQSKYHESPSGLFVPSDLWLSPSQSVRFGDIWSNDWMPKENRVYPYYCYRCGRGYDTPFAHRCPPTTTNLAAVLEYRQIREDYERFRRAALAGTRVPSVEPAPLPVEKRSMPVIGYRAWKTDKRWELGYGTMWRLQSTGVTHHWESGINVAKCGGYDKCFALPVHPSGGWPIPNERHQCGLYVVADVSGVQKHLPRLDENHVVGAALGWGRVVQHGNEGWRAQYARVIALMDMKLSEKNDEIANHISQAYGVPIVERSALERLVSEYGDPVKGD